MSVADDLNEAEPSIAGEVKKLLQQYLPIGDITASFDYLADDGALETRWKQIRELQ